MKVLAINGSPRGETSCTNKMLQPFLKGMKQAGAETDIVHLAKGEIHHCIGCFSCWLKTPGQCIFHDSMSDILKKITWADIIIYGTPLYYFTMTGLLKNMLDRSIPLVLPFMEENKDGITMHPGRYDNKKRKIFLVSPCGFPEYSHFDALVATFKQIAKMCGSTYLGEILRPSAALLLMHEEKEGLIPYLELLENAGKQLFENGKIDKQTLKTLQEPWVSGKEFRERANEYFEKELEKLK